MEKLLHNLARLMVVNSLIIFLLSLSTYLTKQNQKLKTEPVMDTAINSIDISLHNKKNDCWVGYNGQTYNITLFFSMHPGGDAKLLKYCGQDISNAFATKDQDPPKPHSQAAELILKKFLVK